MPPVFRDPFQPQDPYEILYGRPSAKREPSLPPLSLEEEEGLLSKIGHGALSGLGWAGSSLDKAFGGRAIRGLLGGRPEELLSAIPLSDTLGITNPADAVSGAELLGKKDADFLSAEGIGGMGLEMLLDPGTYLTFGAKSAATPLGKIAAKAGLRPATAQAVKGFSVGMPELETLARAATGFKQQGPLPLKALQEFAGKPLGGHVGLGIPFTDIGTTFDLSKPLEVAGRFADAVPGASRFGSWAADKTGPLRRGFSQLFDKPVREQTIPEMQEAARWATNKTVGDLYSAKAPVAEMIDSLQRKAGWQPGMEITPQIAKNIVDQGNQLSDIIERIPHSSWDEFAAAHPGRAADAKAFLAKADPKLVEIGNTYRRLANEQMNAARQLGILTCLSTTSFNTCVASPPSARPQRFPARLR